MSVDRRAYEHNVMGLTNPMSRDIPVPSDVAQPPEPGTEVAGPAMFDLVTEIKNAQKVGQALLKNAESLLDRRSIVVYVTGQTDGSGNADIPLYTVPSGFEFVTTRVMVEAVAFSPAVPYTNAAGWIALIRGNQFGVGAMLDFLPNPPAASGAILPALFTDGAEKAAVVRGGERVSIHIATGPANTDLYCRLQGFTKAV